ncbi:MAG: hypothetical protein LAO21_16240 [Acidobacteriia bacterium]|nr:hypothetical protein [Terriglobia bacterium]
MTRRLSSILLVLALVLSASMLYAADASWTGTISDSHCGAMHAKASKAAETCVEKCIKGGNSYVFVNGADSKVFKLDPADKAKGLGGHEVKVTGTLDGDTIHVTSIQASGKM